jgi:hypothetical protein
MVKSNLFWVIPGILYAVSRDPIPSLLCFMLVPLWNISDALTKRGP